MEDSENWGPRQAQGCEESCKMAKAGELNILYIVQFAEDYLEECQH